MVRKKNARRTNFEESSRPEPPGSEKEPIPLQSINLLAIEVYNPKNVPPVESTVSTESDTSDEDQYVKKDSIPAQSGDDDADE